MNSFKQSLNNFAQLWLTELLIFSMLLFILGLAAVWLVLVKLPSNYLLLEKKQADQILSPVFIIKNILGFLFLLAGILMLFLPGQGLLTIFCGLSLMNFPGKKKLERRIFRSPHIFNLANKIRAKAGQSPLLPYSNHST